MTTNNVDEITLPKQAKIIARELILHPEATRAELEQLLDGRLSTKQPVSRVIKYYWSVLTQLGFAVPAPHAKEIQKELDANRAAFLTPVYSI